MWMLTWGGVEVDNGASEFLINLQSGQLEPYVTQNLSDGSAFLLHLLLPTGTKCIQHE